MALGAACDFAESASFGEFPAADCEAARSGDSCGPSAGQYSSFVSPVHDIVAPSVLLLEPLPVLTSSGDTSRVGTAMPSAGESGWGGPGLRLKMASVAARMLESMVAEARPPACTVRWGANIVYVCMPMQRTRRL